MLFVGEKNTPVSLNTRGFEFSKLESVVLWSVLPSGYSLTKLTVMSLFEAEL